MKILFLVFAYLAGGFPSGYVLFWITDKKDIRNFGSGATGGTNFIRIKGFRWGIPVILIDILKGALPVYLALEFFPEIEVALLSALLAVLGHCFPVYLKFRGGKGVATTVGACAVLAFKPILLSVVLFILIVALTRYVSLGSMLAMMSFPLLALVFGSRKEIIFLGIGLLAIILIRHMGNIQRLIEGKERKFGEKLR